MKERSIQDLVVQYEKELVRQGYKKNSIKNYRTFWNTLVRYFHDNGEINYRKDLAFRFLYERYRITDEQPSKKLTRNEQAVRQIVRKLDYFYQYGEVGRPNRIPSRQIASDAYANLIGEYTDFCLKKEYARSTREYLRNQAITFFIFLEENTIPEIGELTKAHIVDYLNSLSIQNYGTIGHHLFCLRTLLRFLHLAGYHKHDLSITVPKQQSRKGQKVPRIWTEEDVSRLVAAIDRGNPCGKRDYAIILLVTRLGIRAGDVRKLKLTNLKWDSNKIEFVQSKTGHAVSLPLLKEVGWAIIEYLKHGRPKSDSPYLFIRHSAPYTELAEGNCFRHIICRCVELAKISTTFEQKLGMHSLRHTLASALLKKHTPLSTISDILGHAHSDSTSVYLKTDDEALRQCALEVPGSAL